jgi:alanyl-tRNA synthetase
LTELILKEKGLVVNRREFEEEMNKQKQRARNASAQETDDWTVVLEDDVEEFVGFDYTEIDLKITHYRKVVAKKKTLFELVFNVTPFYGESGGQVGDTGYLEADGEKTPIIQTKKEHNQIIHVVKQLPSNLEATFKVVNKKARTLIANNHTATHLIHEALREVLGTHVEQKGSLVNADQLRFDFTHFQKVTKEEIREVEKIVNHRIRENIQLVELRQTPVQEAKDMGAKALFGEKYGDVVRVIKFGTSIELCGGTHSNSTGQLGYCKITSEGSVSAGVRRIEGVTADKAEELIEETFVILDEVTSIINDPNGLQEAISKLVEENSALKKDVDIFETKIVQELKQMLVKNVQEMDGLNVIGRKVPIKNAARLKDICFMLKAEVDNLFCVLGAEFEDDKCGIAIVISDNIVKEKGLNAGQIIRGASKLIRGGGGGQPFFATAGGKHPIGLQEAIDKALESVK